MAGSKKKEVRETVEPAPDHGWSWSPFQGRTNFLWLTSAVVAFVVGGRVLWNQLESEIDADPAFKASSTAITIHPAPPPALKLDLRQETAAALGGERISLLDSDLTEKIGQILALHPWVAGVDRVQKRFPGQVRVDLRYRRPVAAVEVMTREKTGGVYPVDEQGAVLDPKCLAEDFLKSELLRIAAHDLPPRAERYGSTWGDDGVIGAAALAGVLADDWQAAGLYRIEIVDDPAKRRPGSATFRVFSRSGDEVTWGRAPGHEANGEPTAEWKLSRLREHVAAKGPFGRTNEPPQAPLDLRSS